MQYELAGSPTWQVRQVNIRRLLTRSSFGYSRLELRKVSMCTQQENTEKLDLPFTTEAKMDLVRLLGITASRRGWTGRHVEYCSRVESINGDFLES